MSAQHDDPKAAGELLPLAHDEVRKLAASKMSGEAAGHTLQPTALVDVDEVEPVSVWRTVLGKVSGNNTMNETTSTQTEAKPDLLTEIIKPRTK